MPAAELVKDLAAAKAAAAKIGYPVVLKAQSPALPHKTEAGGVIVNLADEAALERFRADFEGTLAAYGLSEAEKAAWREREVVVYCHHGMRSARAVGWLRQQGFAGLHNLEGGIDRWSLEVDANAPRY